MSIMSNIRAKIRAALSPKHGRDLNDDDVQFTPEQLRLSPVPPARHTGRPAPAPGSHLPRHRRARWNRTLSPGG